MNPPPPTSSSSLHNTTLLQKLESDPEIQALTHLRSALSSMLHMLEHVRDDLVTVGIRMEKLTEVSEQYRQLIASQQTKSTEKGHAESEEQEKLNTNQRKKRKESPLILE